MALRADPYGNVFCSDCGGRLAPDWSMGGIVGTMLIADVVTWLVAAVFVVWGMFWQPAYILAACIVMFGAYRVMKNRQRYVCSGCKREFTREQVYGH